jgi:hypothetical protein
VGAISGEIDPRQRGEGPGFAGAGGGAGGTRDELVAKLQGDASHFETEKGTGKAAIAADAKAHEESRDQAHERLEAYDHASAALQLGIVLVTASVITGSNLLVILGGLLGVAGAVMGVLGFLKP